MCEEFIFDGYWGCFCFIIKVLVDWLFWGLCYVVGWFVCKVFIFGFYL